ncbi:MAG: hypothetical protein ACYTG0_45905, partial [Planctomycetota bacterium]
GAEGTVLITVFKLAGGGARLIDKAGGRVVLEKLSSPWVTVPVSGGIAYHAGENAVDCVQSAIDGQIDDAIRSGGRAFMEVVILEYPARDLYGRVQARLEQRALRAAEAEIPSPSFRNVRDYGIDLSRVGSTAEFAYVEGETVHLLANINEAGIVEYAVEATGASIRGTEMFNRMMNHFGNHVRGVRGIWRRGDHWAKVNKLTAAGMSIDEAVTRTWAANRAREWGYVNATVLLRMGRAGSYEVIEVIFLK